MPIHPDTVFVSMVSSPNSLWSQISSNWGLWLAAIGFGVGLIQYGQAQQWKRAEFIAAEMKEFNGNSSVRKALTMIDWSSRSVDLFDYGDAKRESWVPVDRPLQILALRPHKVANRAEAQHARDTGDRSPEQVAHSDHASDLETTDASQRGFTVQQAAIRDCYDALLDGLERFSSFLDSRLIEVQGLKPYLSYWIDDIAAPTQDLDDAAWTFGLLAYIHYYGFSGVQRLFKAFGHDIRPVSQLFLSFEKQSESDLTSAIREELDRQDRERAVNAQH